MATKTKSESKPKAKKAVKKEPVMTETSTFTGSIQGEYSTSVYDNGKLVNFDIDWDKLRDHMKKVG